MAPVLTGEKRSKLVGGRTGHLAYASLLLNNRGLNVPVEAIRADANVTLQRLGPVKRPFFAISGSPNGIIIKSLSFL